MIANAGPELKVSCEEVFGPVCTVTAYDTLDEAIELANGTRYGLQAGIFTGSIKTALAAAQRLEFGGVTVNEAPTFRADQMPYGGVKDSGNTREGPAYAVRELTEDRLVVIELPTAQDGHPRGGCPIARSPLKGRFAAGSHRSLRSEAVSRLGAWCASRSCNDCCDDRPRPTAPSPRLRHGGGDRLRRQASSGASVARSSACVSRSCATSAGSRWRCTGATASGRTCCSSAAPS